MESANDAKSLCIICQRNWSKYTCPRCNLRYCSLDCYKQHNQQCTETFYRESAVQEMEQQYVAGAERNRMLDILKRLHESDASELAELEANESESEDEGHQEADPVLSAELLQKLSIMGDADSLQVQESDLTHEELQAFKRAAASGQLAGLVQPWVPWWSLPEAAEVQLSAVGTSRVTAQGSSGSVSAGSGTGLPCAPEAGLPALSSLTIATPSPLLQWQLLDILYSYVFVMRLYNGEYSTDAQDAAMTLLQVSGVLAATAFRNTNAQPRSKQHAAEQRSDTATASDTTGAMAESASEALNGCMERVCSPVVAGSVGPANAVALLQDLASLMQLGRSATILALNDVQLLFKASVRALTAVGTSKTAVQGTGQHELQDKSGLGPVKHHQMYKHSKKLKNQHSLVLHKLVFMLAWANEQSDASYIDLRDKVLQELQEHNCDLKSKTNESLLDLQPESFVGSMLQQDKLSVQQKPIIETL